LANEIWGQALRRQGKVAQAILCGLLVLDMQRRQALAYRHERHEILRGSKRNMRQVALQVLRVLRAVLGRVQQAIHIR